jgi:hypothetical protein
MENKTIDDAICIPIEGPMFKNLNICGILSERLVCINLHPSDENGDDYQYFLHLEHAKYLRDDLIDVINSIESEEIRNELIDSINATQGEVK